MGGARALPRAVGSYGAGPEKRAAPWRQPLPFPAIPLLVPVPETWCHFPPLPTLRRKPCPLAKTTLTSGISSRPDGPAAEGAGANLVLTYQPKCFLCEGTGEPQLLPISATAVRGVVHAEEQDETEAASSSANQSCASCSKMIL